MIKIGTKRDLYKILHLPIHIQKCISSDIEILDKNYGANRNIDFDMGGFVIVTNSKSDIKLKNFSIDFETPEYVQVICPYKKYLYIAGTERNIIIYEKQ